MKFIVIAILTLFSFDVQAQDAQVPKGYWLTENERAVIHVQNCDESVCGRIHWIIDGGLQFDEFNPDINRQKDPLCGREIMSGFTQSQYDDQKWGGGEIYKADEGDTYSANLTMQGGDKMKVRGYMGISLLGKSQIWTRVSKNKYQKCKVP